MEYRKFHRDYEPQALFRSPCDKLLIVINISFFPNVDVDDEISSEMGSRVILLF